MKPDGITPVKQTIRQETNLLNEINGLLVPVHDLLELVISSGDAHSDALSLARDAIDEFIKKHQ